MKEETVTLSGPGAREGEHVFGVAHIFASFNDTFVVCIIHMNKMNLVYLPSTNVSSFCIAHIIVIKFQSCISTGNLL